MPTGYSLRLALPAGAPVGDAILALDDPVSGAHSTGFGTIVAADPAAVAADPAAQACDAAGHQAVLALQLDVPDSGGQLRVPLFVDAAHPEDPPGTAYRLQLCPPSPGGERLAGLELGLDPSILLEPTAAGTYVWRADVTPVAAQPPALGPCGCRSGPTPSMPSGARISSSPGRSA